MNLYNNILLRNNDIILFIKNYSRKKNKKISSLKIASFIAVPTYIIYRFLPEFDSILSFKTLIFVLATYFIAFLLIFFKRNDQLLSEKSSRKHFAISKAIFVNIFTKSVDKRINYYATKKITYDPIIESKLIKHKLTELQGSDLFSLEIGEKQIQFSNIKLYSGIRVVFKGIFIHLENIDTKKIEENLNLITYKKDWSINQNSAFIAIPLNFKKFLTIELRLKERNLKTILKQIKIVFEIFNFFGAITKEEFYPINEQEKNDLLGDYLPLLNIENKKNVSGYPRVLNYVIDSTTIGIIASLFYLVFSFILNLVSTAHLSEISIIIISLMTYLSYYICLETFFGKTLGKIITKTKVVDLNDNKPSLKKVIIRSFTRLIPYDIYSFVDSELGWHDKLSKTLVVKEKNKKV